MLKVGCELPIILREFCRLVGEGQLRLSRKKEGMEENRKALERFLKDNAGSLRLGEYLSVKERQKKEKEKTVPTKAEKRANVPEERLEFLRQREQRKRQRWGDPVSCEGFETHQTKKLKATLLNIIGGGVH